MDFRLIATWTFYVGVALFLVVEIASLLTLLRQHPCLDGESRPSLLVQAVWTLVPVLVLASLLLLVGFPSPPTSTTPEKDDAALWSQIQP